MHRTINLFFYAIQRYYYRKCLLAKLPVKIRDNKRNPDTYFVILIEAIPSSNFNEWDKKRNGQILLPITESRVSFPGRNRARIEQGQPENRVFSSVFPKLYRRGPSKLIVSRVRNAGKRGQELAASCAAIRQRSSRPTVIAINFLSVSFTLLFSRSFSSSLSSAVPSCDQLAPYHSRQWNETRKKKLFYWKRPPAGKWIPTLAHLWEIFSCESLRAVLSTSLASIPTRFSHKAVLRYEQL